LKNFRIKEPAQGCSYLKKYITKIEPFRNPQRIGGCFTRMTGKEPAVTYSMVTGS
jgi:hypothetical protein